MTAGPIAFKFGVCLETSWLLLLARPTRMRFSSVPVRSVTMRPRTYMHGWTYRDGSQRNA